MQAKRWSLIETLVSTAVGFAVTLCVYEWVIEPIWHLNTSFTENIGMTAVFTFVSIARGYLLRRFFNWTGHRT